MQLAYIAGPYRADKQHEVSRNIRNAEQLADYLWRKGYAAICPHKNSAHLDGCAPDENFLAGYLKILSKCDVMFMLDGWKQSEGSREEYKLANQLQIPIKFVTLKQNQVIIQRPKRS